METYVWIILLVVAALVGALLMAVWTCVSGMLCASVPRQTSLDQPHAGVHRNNSEVRLFGSLSQLGLPCSGSPFVNKAAALLRGFDIPHRVQPTSPAKAPRGKIPFLVHTHADPNDPSKDVVVTDSAMIARYLVNTFGKSPEGDSQPRQIGRMLVAPRRAAPGGRSSRARRVGLPCGGRGDLPAAAAAEGYPQGPAWTQAASLRLCLENVLYFFGIYDNWVSSDSNMALMSAAFLEPVLSATVRGIVVPIVRAKVKGACDAHGAAKHGAADASALVAECLDLAESVLGDGRAFVTGQVPSEEDAAIYVQLEQVFRVAMTGLAKDYVLQHCPSIVAYCRRMRELLYPEMTADASQAEALARGAAATAGGTAGEAGEGDGASLRVPLAGAGAESTLQERNLPGGRAGRVLAWGPDLADVTPAQALPMVHRLKSMEAEVRKDKASAGWWRPADHPAGAPGPSGAGAAAPGGPSKDLGEA